MNRMKRLGGLVLAILLAVPVSGGLASPARAQGGSGLTEQQRREMEQKYQEEWEFREKLDKQQEDTGARLEKAVQRRQDAERRRRQAEKRMQQPEQQPPGGKTE